MLYEMLFYKFKLNILLTNLISKLIQLNSDSSGTYFYKLPSPKNSSRVNTKNLYDKYLFDLSKTVTMRRLLAILCTKGLVTSGSQARAKDQQTQQAASLMCEPTEKLPRFSSQTRALVMKSTTLMYKYYISHTPLPYTPKLPLHFKV